MADMLVQLGANAAARKVISTIGLPIPLPQKLARREGPLEARPLANQHVSVGGVGAVVPEAVGALAAAGASIVRVGPAQPEPSVVAAAEGWSTRVESQATTAADGLGAHTLVFDATAFAEVADLDALHAYFHPRVRQLERCGRVVVIGRPAASATDPETRAVRTALDGFTRSLAKELGRKGATANRIEVARGAEDRLGPALVWLVSDRAAYVSGQPLCLDLTVAGAPPRPQSTRPLEGRTALVTGAARGIGAATARRLGEEGAMVLCLDRPEDADTLAVVAREVGGVPLGVDVTAADAGARICAAAVGSGGLDVVVHNAGVTRDRTLGRMDEDTWGLTMAVNLAAIVAMHRAMVERPGVEGGLNDGARIVCLSSIAGIAGNVGQTNYAATKAAVAGFVRGLAPQLAPRRIAVNAVAPGFIETRMTAAIPLSTREPARRLCNLAQGGQPSDVAEAITFLAGPAAIGLSGAVLRVCGGNLIGA